MKGSALFPRYEIYKVAKIHWRNLKIFSRITASEPISTKLSTMHLWVKIIQIYSNEGSNPFPKGDNFKIAIIHWRNLRFFFSRTTGPILTKLGTMHPDYLRVKEFKGQNANYELVSYQCDGIIMPKWLNLYGFITQVSNVAQDRSASSNSWFEDKFFLLCWTCSMKFSDYTTTLLENKLSRAVEVILFSLYNKSYIVGFGKCCFKVH